VRASWYHLLSSGVCHTSPPGEHNDFLPLLKEAASLTSCPLASRSDASLRWISASRRHQHESALEAYMTALELLHTSVAISRTLNTRYNRLSNCSPQASNGSLGPDAASLAIEKGDLEKAIELLELGRSILFTQLGQYRTPVDDLRKVDGSLADRFTRLSAQLNVSALPSTKNSVDMGKVIAHSSEDDITRCVICCCTSEWAIL
jgi:hypothetical protein